MTAIRAAIERAAGGIQAYLLAAFESELGKHKGNL